jgi:hypothetical protein
VPQQFRILDWQSSIARKTGRNPGQKSSLSVTREMFLYALGEQAFAASLAPARKRGPSRFGFHARTKAVLLFPGALGCLVSAFHKNNRFGAIGEPLQ